MVTKLKATVVQNAAPGHESIFSAMFDQLEMPSTNRMVVSLLAAVVVAGCASYMSAALVSYLVIGAALLTGSAFLTFMVAFIGYAITVTTSMIIAGKVQTFILSGDIDRCYQKVSVHVRGWMQSTRSTVSS